MLFLYLGKGQVIYHHQIIFPIIVKEGMTYDLWSKISFSQSPLGLRAANCKTSSAIQDGSKEGGTQPSRHLNQTCSFNHLPTVLLPTVLTSRTATCKCLRQSLSLLWRKKYISLTLKLFIYSTQGIVLD